MREESVRDVYNRVYGYIRYLDNGDKEALDFPSRMVLGRYVKLLDQTTDLYGRVVSRGDTVVSFLKPKF